MINLPYGLEDFQEVIENNCYYVDKTGFIKELLSETFKVSLITRPRRFGKTLTLDMLAKFFDIQKDSRRLFDGLKILEETELCNKWMNQYSVLSVTFKDIEDNTYDNAYEQLTFLISSLCGMHEYLLESEKVRDADKKIFRRLLNQNGKRTDVKNSLLLLTRMMNAYYGKQTILLIDEYDVPLAKAYDRNYYSEMLDIIRGILSTAWKSNSYLKFAVVTGCLRIAKESIFTGANNFISNSISDVHFNRYIGFTELEVVKMLEDAGFSNHLDEIKAWYDGYIFGGIEIYCPWDVLMHIRDLGVNPLAKPKNHWTDTSHNNIIRTFIEDARFDVREEFERLFSGGIVYKNIVEDMTYDLANSSEDNLWSILYLTGYLTYADISKNEFPTEKMPLRIPNEEVRAVFAKKIKEWFEDTMKTVDRSKLFNAWWNGDTDILTEEISNILNDTISYYDYREDYYHAFIAGIFTGAGYFVESNKESGIGRTDIVVQDRNNRRAIIIEAKRSKSDKEMAHDCDKALRQITENNYTGKLTRNFQTVVSYGIAFFQKSCLIKIAK